MGVKATGALTTPLDGSVVQLPAGSCFYRQLGDGAPPIVMLHGLPTDSRIYGRLQRALASHHRTIAPDLLGWGFSHPNEGLPGGFGTLDRVLGQFIDALDLNDVVLLAHEMSGPPAIRWAAANADRIRALVLMNTYYGWNSARMPEALVAMRLRYSSGFGRKVLAIGGPGLGWWIYRWQLRRLWARGGPDVERLLRDFYAIFRRSRTARRALLGIVEELSEQIDANQRQLDILTSVPCPTLVVWGQRDPYLTPSVARQFHRLAPNSDLRMIASAGHFPQWDAAPAVAEAVQDFLSSHPR